MSALLPNTRRIVLSRILAWILALPGFIRTLPSRMRTWPERIKVWAIRKFWEFVAWVKDLPRRIKLFAIYLYEGVRDQLLIWGAAIGAFFARLTAPVVKFLRTQMDTDPSKYPPAKLKIKQRGRKVAIFSRQLASMSQGGVPLVQALDVLSEQTEDPRFAYAIGQIAGNLSTGYSFSKATSEFPKIFPPVFFHLMKSGENTGRLTEVIEQLADLLEAEEDMVKRVRGALSYPLFIAGVTFVLTIGLFSTVLPGFAEFYDDFNVELPAITAFLMALTKFITTPWFWIILILGSWGAYHFTKISWEIPERRLIMYQLLVKIPLVGPIVSLSCLARFCWVLELTQDAGLDLVKSLKLAGLASGSATLLSDNLRVVRGITDGDNASELMTHRPELYPTLLQQMLMMGEETSRVSEACGRAARWFEQEVDGRIDSFQAALEPILMGGVSLVVGTIVLAVFLPLYGLLDKLGV